MFGTKYCLLTGDPQIGQRPSEMWSSVQPRGHNDWHTMLNLIMYTYKTLSENGHAI